LSSALDVRFPRDATRASEMATRLGAFADTTYLHQVVQHSRNDLHRYPDLDVALAERTGDSPADWRIHFHVPLFAREYEVFGSTQDYVQQVLELALERSFTTHLEIETYTWDVLPPGLKVDLGESIAREYEWVLQTVGEARPSDTGTPRP
jgi:hypothetical protein